MAEQQKQEHFLLEMISQRPRTWLTGGAIGISAIADIATHTNPGVMFVGGLLALAVGVSSKEVVEMIVPGSNPDQVRASLDTVVQAATPEIEEEYADQRALSKLRRLLHDRNPDLYETQDVARPGDRPAQPKDDARRVVDVSEEEYLTPLPTPQLKQAQQQEEYDWYSDDEDDTALPTVSGLFTFSDVLAKGFIPTLKNIYVGSHPDGTPIYVEAKDLCHVALAGNTGGGKSSLMRMLMAQLCYAGATVLLLNPHYTPYDREHDEDWTPFIPFLKESPLACAEYKNIEYYIKALVEIVLPKRQARVRAGELPGKPYFVVIDELPAIAKKCKDVPGAMEELLREGRKYGIFLIVASQDFLVKTIGTDGGAVRQCFRTAFYVGGDTTTARNLLEKELVIPETSLGKGTVMLRCAATKQTVLAKVPYVDNAVLYRLLGPSTFVPGTPGELPANSRMSGIAQGVSGSPAMKRIERTPQELPETRYNDSHVGYSENMGASTGYPERAVNQPVEALPRTPGQSLFTKEDRMLNEVQIAQFMALYPVIGNIQKSLAKIEGCSNRHSKHAGLIVKEFGLKKEKV